MTLLRRLLIIIKSINHHSILRKRSLRWLYFLKCVLINKHIRIRTLKIYKSSFIFCTLVVLIYSVDHSCVVLNSWSLAIWLFFGLVNTANVAVVRVSWFCHTHEIVLQKLGFYYFLVLLVSFDDIISNLFFLRRVASTASIALILIIFLI